MDQLHHVMFDDDAEQLNLNAHGSVGVPPQAEVPAAQRRLSPDVPQQGGMFAVVCSAGWGGVSHVDISECMKPKLRLSCKRWTMWQYSIFERFNVCAENIWAAMHKSNTFKKT